MHLGSGTAEGLPVTVTMYFTKARRKGCECSNHKEIRNIEKTDLNIIYWVPPLKHYMELYVHNFNVLIINLINNENKIPSNYIFV